MIATTQPAQGLRNGAVKTCFIAGDSTGQAARLNFANLIIDAAKKGERSDLLARPCPSKRRSEKT
jgi:hypothetical protein